MDAPPETDFGDGGGSGSSGGAVDQGQTSTTSPGSAGNDAADSADDADMPDDSEDGPADADAGSDGDTDAGNDADDTVDTDTDTDTDTDDDASDADGPGDNGLIDVSLDGCAIDFSGTIIVSYNGSLGVAGVPAGGGLNGSFQFDLEGPDTFALSTQHRVDTGTVVNMIDVGQGTWSNIDPEWPDADAVGGTMDVETWNPSEGQATVLFDNVTLVNVGTGAACTINGTVEAYALI